jgi:hypothetical protein
MSSRLFLFRRAGHRQMRGRDHEFPSRLKIVQENSKRLRL